nr:methyltransferase domain-containing protein [Cytophagales bacterium]
MKTDIIPRLCCPISRKPLTLSKEDAVIDSTGEIQSGFLVSEDGQTSYPIRNYIPRFVGGANYADNFGMQWNFFARTQLDSYSGQPISAERFWNTTGWKPEDIQNKWVLDIGCGSGRFAEIALKGGANVVAIDYSTAVDACYANLKMHPKLHIIQCDIYSLPFLPETFDFLYSLGVLQHTPDVKKAFAALPPMLIEGGRICTDFYWNRLSALLNPRYLIRPISKRMNKEKLFKFLEKAVPRMLKINQLFGRAPYIGKFLKKAIPVADYSDVYQLSPAQQQEWALLDTFDMLAPAYDNPQSIATVSEWFHTAGIKNIEVFHCGHLVARGVKEITSH